MSGAVFDEYYLLFVFHATVFRAQLVEYRADRFDYLYVLPLAAAADVVRLARDAALHDCVKRAAVVFDVEPVADVFAVAIDRKLLGMAE